MESSTALLSPERRESGLRCFLCWKFIRKGDKKTSCIGEIGLPTLKEQAKLWSQIDVPLEVNEHNYTQVDSRLCEWENSGSRNKIIVHSTCRTNFRTRVKTFQNSYGVKLADTVEQSELTDTDGCSPVKHATRFFVDNVKTLERKCFICNEIRTSDDNPYNEGGLQRCNRGDTGSKIMTRKDVFLNNKSSRHYSAAKRLDILLSGSARDIFAADICYHQSCYIKFVIKPVVPATNEEIGNSKRDDVLNLFKYKVTIKIIRDKEAYLLHELLKDVKYLSAEQDRDTPAIEHTSTLKMYLITNFEENIAFFPSGKYLLVHPIDINPCTYSVATLHGCGLRDGELTKAFGRMIRRKFEERKTSEDTWPRTPDELLSKLDSGPLPELYNAIYFSIYERGKINQYGYAETSDIKASKIWSLASDWESMITKQRTPMQIILGLVLHRITGSKEAITALHKTNHVISYNDIRMQNVAWARMVSAKPFHFPNFRKGVVTHSTIDNNDGRQETMTGVGTTHDTNMTLFQVPSAEEISIIPVIGEEERPLVINDDTKDWGVEPLPYAPGKRVGPAVFTNFCLQVKTDYLEESLKRDIAWSLCGTLNDEDLPLLGSWTPYNKLVSSHDCESIIQEYLPVKPHPPEYPVCKEYLDFLLDLIEELELPFIYAHSDEMVYAKLCDILWNNKDVYSKVILLMGGFHQLRVMQRLLYKRHHCKGYMDWCIDAKTIAGGSAEQAFEGRHYYRSMRVHKECFDALVQYRIENLTENLSKLSSDMVDVMRQLRFNPTTETLENLMQLQEFNDIVSGVLQYEKGSDAELTVNYVKDVSLMLSLVAAVRESDIEKHLQAEQKMTCLSFAYDHHNYARYNTYQNVFLSDLKQSNHVAFQQLQSKGMGGSITGEKFSAIHGDLITELFNKETKGTSGPFRCGFSTDIDSVNTWVNTIHIHTVLRTSLRTVLHIKTSSKHKEVTPRGKRLHAEHVRNLKNKLRGYGVDPFSTSFPKQISRGDRIDDSIVNDMLRAPEVGMTQFKAFIEERLVKGKVSFFSPIKKNNLQTGIKKKKKTPKAVEVLKEDCQAFGMIVSKSLTLEEAFQYPITSVPLSVASPDGHLRQSEKASLRNFLIEESGSTSNIMPKKAAWLVDGMAAVQTLKSKKTYGEWIESLIRFITPPDIAEAALVGMINDTYNKCSAKSGTRIQRGEEHQRTYVEGFQQHMPSGIKWHEFLRNAENKEQLLELIKRYVFDEKGRRLIKTPFVITVGDKIHKLQQNSDQEEDCNHEEADTRLVLLALQEQTDVIIVAKDTDVLVLLVWAYKKYHVRHKWYFKYDAEKYADVGAICDFLEEDVCLALPAFHAITGCDTTSYFYRAGKLRVFKKVNADKTKLNLLDALGKEKELTFEDLRNIKEFIRSVIYSGKDGEDYVDTRIRLYKTLKNKSSMPLPPDPDSVIQVIKRAHCQAYEWYRCGQPSIDHLNLDEFGWSIQDGDVKPVWFVGDQFPPSVRTVHGAKVGDNSVADDENSSSEQQPPRKKARRRVQKGKKSRRKKNCKDQNLEHEVVISNAKPRDKSVMLEESSAFNDSGEEGDNDSNGGTDGCLVEDDSCDESEWEISDFLSSNDSCDEWLP